VGSCAARVVPRSAGRRYRRQCLFHPPSARPWPVRAVCVIFWMTLRLSIPYHRRLQKTSVSFSFSSRCVVAGRMAAPAGRLQMKARWEYDMPRGLSSGPLEQPFPAAGSRSEYIQQQAVVPVNEVFEYRRGVQDA